MSRLKTPDFCLRNFSLSIGPQRAATSWINQYLENRGDICLPNGVKEIFFFDRHYKKGSRFYLRHFTPKPEDKRIVEIATTYFDDPQAPGRLLDFIQTHKDNDKDNDNSYNSFGEDPFGGIQLICSLREPVARSYSLYRHYLRYGIVSGDLEQAVQQKPQILESSRYSEHLARWFKCFGRDRITILYREELQKDPEAFVEKLCGGLGVPVIDAEYDAQQKVNQTGCGPSHTLAAIAQKSADWLRGKGLYWPINLAKSLGLKSFIFGGKGKAKARTGPNPAEIKFLQDHLGQEKTKLETLLGHPIVFWNEKEINGTD